MQCKIFFRQSIQSAQKCLSRTVFDCYFHGKPIQLETRIMMDMDLMRAFPNLTEETYYRSDDQWISATTAESRNPDYPQHQRIDPLYLNLNSLQQDLQPIIQCSLSLCAKLRLTIEEGKQPLVGIEAARSQGPPIGHVSAKNISSSESTVFLHTACYPFVLCSGDSSQVGLTLRGARVESVTAGSPAFIVGLTGRNETIVLVDGRAFPDELVEDAVQGSDIPGSSVVITVARTPVQPSPALAPCRPCARAIASPRLAARQPTASRCRRPAGGRRWSSAIGRRRRWRRLR